MENKRVPLNTPFFYGWMIVLLSGLGIFFSSPGQTYGVSIFIDSYIAEFGWSRSFVSSLYSLGTLTAGFLLFVVGRQIDRRGHRIMLPVIAFVFGLACIWMSLVLNPLMLFGGFFLVRLLGQGSMSLAGSTLTPQWFVKNRGKAMSLAALGGVIGSAVTPPFNTWMIQTLGWRVGWQVWALLLWVVMVPVGYLLIRNRPEDVGLTPDNEGAIAQSGSADDLVEQRSWTLMSARRTRTFWLLLFCMFVPSMVNTGTVFHFVSIMGEQSITPAVAASVLSLTAIAALPSTFLAGYILDRYPLRIVMTITFVFQAIAMVILLRVSSVALALSYGVLRGSVQGFEAMCFNVMWPNYFGRKHLGSIRGFAMTSTVIGSAFGPLPFGIAFDLFGGYTQILLLMLIFPAVAGVCAFLARKPGED